MDISTRQNMGFSAQKFLVVVDKVDFLGDLSAGFKVIHDLHERLFVPLENLTLTSNDVNGCKIFNKYNLKVKPTSIERIEKAIDKKGINFQLITSADTRTAHSYATGKIPTIALCEYDLCHDECEERTNGLLVCLSMGLAKESIGINISPSLKEWGFSDESKNSLNRITQLQNICDTLRKEILGNKNFETFDEQSRLYISYARSVVLSEYVKQIVSLNGKNSKNLVFVLSEFEPASFDKESLSSRIGKLKIVKFNNGTQKSECIEKCIIGTGKKIKIIIGSFANKDMFTLFKASEKEVVVTGDQSITEAISANKNLIYAAPKHKLVFQKCLMELNYPTLNYETDRIRGYFPNFAKEVNLEKSNKLLCKKYDYLPKLIQTLEKLSIFFVPTQSLKHIKNHQIFCDSIQFNVEYLINLEQMCHLEVQYKDSKSLLDRFKDSVFKQKSFGQDYLITRLQV